MVNTMMLVLALSGLCAQQAAEPDLAMSVRTHRIIFTGTASGGSLTLVQEFNRNPHWISIETNPGEPAQVVLERLGRAINEYDPFAWGRVQRYSKGKRLPDGDWVQATDGSIGPFPGGLGAYLIAGSETGLGIPPPPKSLSCSYHADTGEVVLNWEDPSSGYDSILVLMDGFGGSIGPNSGNRTEYTLAAAQVAKRRANRENPGIENLDLSVVGTRGGIASSAAVITYKDNGQEELNGFPFSNGVAPNWTAWSTRAAGPEDCEQKHKQKKIEGTNLELIKVSGDGKVTLRRTGIPHLIRGPADRPFIQIIKTSSPEAVAGVYRKFLGLTPGHTYRLSARLLALDMKQAEGDWSFSLHAVPAVQAQSNLTVQQMAGMAALPDGKAGAEAGRITLYAPGVAPAPPPGQPTTQPKRRAASAPADEPVADLVTGDIALPQGADTIVVWVRHQAAHSTGVGLDWVRLEDVTGK